MRKRGRRWWWRHVRGYEHEICDGCGRPVAVVWVTDDVLWDEIGRGVLCVACFDRECAARGIILTWEARDLVRLTAS